MVIFILVDFVDSHLKIGVFLKVGDHVPDVLNLDELDAKKVKHALITNDNGPKPILAQSHDRRVTFLQV